MPDFFTSPVVQAATAVVVLCILISVAFYVVASYRDYVTDDREITSEALANLEEMHRKGEISEAEIRTIKARTQQHSAVAITNDASSPGGEASPNNPSERLP